MMQQLLSTPRRPVLPVSRMGVRRQGKQALGARLRGRTPHTRSCSTASAEMSQQVTRFHMKRVRSHTDSAAQMRASVTDTGLRTRLHVSALLPLQGSISQSRPAYRPSGTAHITKACEGPRAWLAVQMHCKCTISRSGHIPLLPNTTLTCNLILNCARPHLSPSSTFAPICIPTTACQWGGHQLERRCPAQLHVCSLPVPGYTQARPE